MTRRLSTLNLVSSDGRRMCARMPRRSAAAAHFLSPGATARAYPHWRCPRATRSTTRRTASGRSSRATCPDALETPHPRFGRDRWPERLAGRAVRSVDAHGKHLFLRFEGGLTIHSHLRMTGSWGVYDRGAALAPRAAPRMARDPPRRARGRAVRRPGARADDRLAHAARPADRRPRARHPRAGARRGALPAAPARGRPDAPDRRRAARPAHDRRDRQPLEERGLLRGRRSTRGGRPARSPTTRCWRSSPRRARGCSESAADGIQDRSGSIYGKAGPPVPALRRADRRRAARATTTARPTGARDASVRRIGHKGADHIAPGNTPASFDAALAHGVDMIEFDVLPEDARDGARRAAARARLHGRLAAHADARGGARALRRRGYAGVELDVDLKLPGYEERVVDALRAHGLVERTLVSTMDMRSLVKLRALEPELRLGWSVPRVKRDYTRNPALRRARLRAAALRAPAAARASPRATSRRAARRADVPLQLVTPRCWRPSARRRRALRLDGRRRRADRRSRRSASPA